MRSSNNELGSTVVNSDMPSDEATLFELVHQCDYLTGIEREELGEVALRRLTVSAGKGQHGVGPHA